MELLEQNPYLVSQSCPCVVSFTACVMCGVSQDAVVVPVGGGGLIAGMSLFLKAINPRIKVGSESLELDQSIIDASI